MATKSKKSGTLTKMGKTVKKAAQNLAGSLGIGESKSSGKKKSSKSKSGSKKSKSSTSKSRSR